MSKVITVILIAFVGVNLTYGWGSTGHRVVGEIAYEYLSPKARKKLAVLLKGQSISVAGTWMDEIRSNRKYDFMADWHWVTIPDGMSYKEAEKNPNGYVVEVIERITKELKSKSLRGTVEEERVKILIHLVADIHQPLHVGTGLDRGGNETKVKWKGTNSNLHRVWDSDMIDETSLSVEAFCKTIQRPGKSEMTRIRNATIHQWIKESMALRRQVYSIGKGSLGEQYLADNLADLKERLLFAGIRLAGVLNDIYK